ncbi:similar to ILITYHIA [Actinidia rufa]|uniref:Similar to ILITYHIA n=1 Tax=Actinidia rufa TaxID=165716 RepID=A0A7J0GUJ3_9ERIC|nr:similar to ILITYHIA [Actinidia rufa]
MTLRTKRCGLRRQVHVKNDNFDLSVQSVAELAEDVWDRYGYDFGTDYAGIFKALSHVNYNVRLAAAEALAAALDENPNTIQESLSTLFSLYIRDAGFGEDNIDAGWLGRRGIALALHSATDVLQTKDLLVVVTFLISRALVVGSTNEEIDIYGERLGAAFGLAGVVKEFGISRLKEYNIVTAP